MTSPIAGKTIALTGTFTQLKRAEAEAKLTALGATIAKSLNAKTDLLICGDKAGSKIAKAQTLKVEVRDEAWLMDILAGGDGQVEAPALEGPLSDYFDKLDAYVANLRKDQSLIVGYVRAPGASADRIDKLAKKWGLDSFAPSIRNLYLQADGFCVFWLKKGSPELKSAWASPHVSYFKQLAASKQQPVIGKLPTKRDMVMLPRGFGGAIWLLPIADALHKTKSATPLAHGIYADEETRELFGHTYKGEAFERGLRVFEEGNDFNPSVFVMSPVSADPKVIIGDDYGADWFEELRSFEDHMLRLLESRLGESALAHYP